MAHTSAAFIVGSINVVMLIFAFIDRLLFPKSKSSFKLGHLEPVFQRVAEELRRLIGDGLRKLLGRPRPPDP